jgi:hypothetical protein
MIVCMEGRGVQTESAHVGMDDGDIDVVLETLEDPDDQSSVSPGASYVRGAS